MYIQFVIQSLITLPWCLSLSVCWIMIKIKQPFSSFIITLAVKSILWCNVQNIAVGVCACYQFDLWPHPLLLLPQISSVQAFDLRPYLDLFTYLLSLADSWQQHRLVTSLKGYCSIHPGHTHTHTQKGFFKYRVVGDFHGDKLLLFRGLPANNFNPYTYAFKISLPSVCNNFQAHQGNHQKISCCTYSTIFNNCSSKWIVSVWAFSLIQGNVSRFPDFLINVVAPCLTQNIQPSML